MTKEGWQRTIRQRSKPVGSAMGSFYARGITGSAINERSDCHKV